MPADSNFAPSTDSGNAPTSVGTGGTNPTGNISLGRPTSADAGQEPEVLGGKPFANTSMADGLNLCETFSARTGSQEQADQQSKDEVPAQVPTGEEHSLGPLSLSFDQSREVPATACLNIVFEEDPWKGICALVSIPGTGYTKAVFTSPVSADRKLKHVAVGQVSIYETDDEATAISYNIRVYAKVDGKPFVKVWGANPNKMVATEKTIDITKGTTPTDIVTENELISFVKASAMKEHSELFYAGFVDVMNDILRQYRWKE
ncbi:hypothetical protein QFC21_006280 [Naganishia friedmannii]|uniref:Uncharacterized protein n=1 Tax=Naganishia friedmannii TaxID=89922 RepID=A0ACC2V2V4_9TREE|nr:hypothetical protein QFC21_006280 [Naganishia friedmannii]